MQGVHNEVFSVGCAPFQCLLLRIVSFLTWGASAVSGEFRLDAPTLAARLESDAAAAAEQPLVSVAGMSVGERPSAAVESAGERPEGVVEESDDDERPTRFQTLVQRLRNETITQGRTWEFLVWESVTGEGLTWRS